MKTILLLLCIGVLGCTNVDQDKPVDKSKLRGTDYRLFQDTPAWELAKAVQNEDLVKIEKIVSKNAEIINYQEPIFGSTLLMLTIRNQQLKPFKTLLENDANVNIHSTYNGTSAIIEACEFKGNDIRFLELLIQYGADVNDQEVGEREEGNRTRYTPLLAASKTGRLDMVELLVSNGANVNYQNEFDQTALSYSVLLGRYDVTYYLLEHGADYKRKLFTRPDPERDVYLVDILREVLLELGSSEYKNKMEVVNFLKSKGVDYRSSPIPNYIKEKAKQRYPDTWEEYLEKY